MERMDMQSIVYPSTAIEVHILVHTMRSHAAQSRSAAMLLLCHAETSTHLRYWREALCSTGE